MKIHWQSWISFFILFLVACNTVVQPAVPARVSPFLPTATPSSSLPSKTPQATPTRLAPKQPPKNQSTQPVPLPFRAAQSQIANALSIPLDQVMLISSEPVQWPDSCLGAAQAGEMCLDVVTEGYLLIFETPVGKIEVHTDKSGSKIRLIPTPEISTALAPVVIWERNGGIAGTCRRLTIAIQGAYTLEDCNLENLLTSGTFSPALQADLNAYLARFAQFEWTSVPLPGSADMFLDTIIFRGRGSEEPDDDQKIELNEFLGKLAHQAALFEVPRQQPDSQP